MRFLLSFFMPLCRVFRPKCVLFLAKFLLNCRLFSVLQRHPVVTIVMSNRQVTPIICYCLFPCKPMFFKPFRHFSVSLFSLRALSLQLYFFLNFFLSFPLPPPSCARARGVLSRAVMRFVKEYLAVLRWGDMLKNITSLSPTPVPPRNVDKTKRLSNRACLCSALY